MLSFDHLKPFSRFSNIDTAELFPKNSAEMLTQLALSAPPQDRETGFSYLSRLAARHGLAAHAFALDFGLTLRAIIDGDNSALADLATLGGVDPEPLQDWSPVHAEGRLHLFRGEEFHVDCH